MARKRIATIDCETDPFSPGVYPQPFVWGYFDEEIGFRSWWGPTCTDDLAQWLVNRECDAYAHNGGKFDFHYLGTYLTGRRRIRIHEDRLVSAQLGRTRLIDSYPILPFGLGTHFKLGIDYEWFREGIRDAHRDEILAYLRQDCESLWELVYRFRLEYGPQLSLAAAGYKSLRDRCGLLPAGSKRFDEQFRAFYFGGRMEAIQTGVRHCTERRAGQGQQGPWHYVDQNGAYANAMRSYLYPASHSYRVSKRLPDRLEELEMSLVEFKGFSQGCLPFRSPIDSSVCYPNTRKLIEAPIIGENTFRCTGHELLAGLETNTVRISKIENVYTFQMPFSMEPWVSEMWQKRREADAMGDRAGSHFYKTMLVAVSGKFGQYADRHRNYYLFPWHPWGGPLSDLTPGGVRSWEYCGRWNRWWVWARHADHSPGYVNVAVAALITGAVRARMWRALQSAEDPLYIDTDGIICRDYDPPEGYGLGLGQWKREGPFDVAAVGGPKLYALAHPRHNTQPPLWSPKLKHPTVDCEDIIQCVGGKEITWRSHAPTYSMKRGRSFHARTLYPAKVPGSAWYLERNKGT